jgi:hypothetical protein
MGRPTWETAALSQSVLKNAQARALTQNTLCSDSNGLEYVGTCANPGVEKDGDFSCTLSLSYNRRFHDVLKRPEGRDSTIDLTTTCKKSSVEALYAHSLQSHTMVGDKDTINSIFERLLRILAIV